MDRLGRPSTLGGYTLSFNYLIPFVVYSGPRLKRHSGLNPGSSPGVTFFRRSDGSPTHRFKDFGLLMWISIETKNLGHG